jgi:uncharacterized membrane protein
MKHAPSLLSLLLPVALLAGCAGGQRTYTPVSEISYAAVGHDPFWSLAIGDDAIVLGLPPAPGTRDIVSHRYPRVLPRTVDGVRRWDSGEGTGVISVEARSGPCTGSGGMRYSDHVRVRLSGRELEGCGGRLLSGRRG